MGRREKKVGASPARRRRLKSSARPSWAPWKSPRRRVPLTEFSTSAALTLGTGPAKVLRTVEKPKPEVAPSNYAIIGRYVFEPTLFDHLKEVKPGVGGEIQLTDGMDRLCKAGKLYALKIEGSRYDIGNHLSYVKAQLDAALRRPELADRLRQYLRTL